MAATILRLALLLVTLASTLQPAWAEGGRRVALVIGNSAYRSVNRLDNPANDAKLIAAALREAGFTLVGDGPLLDLDKARFDRALQSFGRELQGADVALFYYSGHGMQVNGVNWLVPIDANPVATRDLDFQMVDASLVLRQMEGSGTRLNMLLLDACRNNPFAKTGVRGAQPGLAEMRAPEGTLISYATQPGNVAADGSGRDSPYTAALVNAIKRPGTDVFQVFNNVGLAVKQATSGDQQPWFSSSPVSGNFFFFAGPVTIQPAPAVNPDAIYWDSIARSNDPADFRSYLQRFPNGLFVELAQRRLAGFAPPPPSIAAATKPFDGIWTILLKCEATPDGARGWVRRLLGLIRDGTVHAEGGVRGQPDYISIDGAIGADGRGLLPVHGLTGDAASTIDHRSAGTPYRYDMLATFDAAHGVANRVAGRVCVFDFQRQ